MTKARPNGLATSWKSRITVIAVCVVCSLSALAQSPVVGWGNSTFGQATAPDWATEVVAVTAGGSHSLALLRDGTVTGWGRDNNGQATAPTALSDVAAIAAGANHSLALTSNGVVFAWGLNTYGQTSVPEAASNVVALDAGTYHSLALRADGRPIAWGRNYVGVTNVPAGLSNVVGIAAGDLHNLALRADGSVVAWGYNASGETSVPAGLTPVAAVAAGDSHSLALRLDGTVIAWGNNSGGQTNVPVGLTDVVAISAGNSHSLALLADGTVVAWGRNTSGQTNVPPGLSGVTAIAGGGSHSLALVGNGAPRCFPVAPAWEVLGGSTVTLQVPVTGELPLAFQWQFNLTNLPSATNRWLQLTNVQMSQAGPYLMRASNNWDTATSDTINLIVLPFRVVKHPQPVVALLRGTATFSAQLEGEGPFSYQWRFNDNPLPQQTNATLVMTNLQWSAAGLYSVTITNRHGSNTTAAAQLDITPIAAWGWNGRGETNVPPGLSNVVAICSGASHSLALKRDGTVMGWGSYEYSSIPVAPPAGLSNVVEIAAGGEFSAALKTDGRVEAWCGFTTPGTNLPPDLTNVVSIAAGNSHGAALRADGSVVSWGHWYGTYQNAPMVTPDEIGPIVGIACGTTHSLAVRAEGTVVAWGDSAHGKTDVPAGLSNVIAVAGGANHSLALKADGTVVAWGDGQYGQTNIPPGLSNVVEIAARLSHNLARKADGSVVVWGAGDYGVSNVPTALNSVADISCANTANVALVGDGFPWFPPGTVRVTGLGNLTAFLTARVSGAWPMSFQWQWHGTNLPAATNLTLTLPQLQMNQGGNYRLVAANAHGTNASPDIPLTMAPLRILYQPKFKAVITGQPASLSAGLEGQGPFTFQWRQDGKPVSSTETFSLASTAWTNTGQYTVTVSNAHGSVISSNAALHVVPVAAWGNGNLLSQFPTNLTNAVGIGSGGFSTLAVRRDGRVTAWGNAAALIDAPAAASNTMAVASGNDHSLALQSNGTVIGWGHPIYGTTYGQSTPPADLTNAVAVTAGGDHSMALTEDGQIVAWGSDYYGQSKVWPGLYNVVAIADGGFHSLALKSDGRVVGWGLNASGQTSPPDDLTNAVAIAAGDNQSLALRADGRVVAWGHGIQGQTNVPPGLSNAVSVASGYLHSLGVRADGGVLVWGSGEATNPPAWLGHGFVGAAASSYTCTVLEGNGPPFVPPVVRSRIGLRGATMHLYAPATGGLPLRYQWQFKGTNFPSATNAVLSLTNLATSHAGNYRLIVSNAWGITSSADMNVIIEPLRITVPPQDQETYLGGAIAMQVTLEGLGPFTYQWLHNDQPIAGQTNAQLWLGGMDWTNEGPYSVLVSNVFGSVTSAVASVQLTPFVAPYDSNLQAGFPTGLRDIVAISSGLYGSNYLALKSNRTLVAWGRNSNGQTNVSSAAVNVVAISAGPYHNLAVLANGRVLAWGLNDSGQTNVPAGLSNVVAVAAGAIHSLALKADGTVVAWGAGAVGGQSDVPAGLSNVVAIAAGNTCSLALRADGTVVAWGTYYNGSGGYPPMTVPSGLSDVLAIGAGYDHAVAACGDGRVVAWGAQNWTATNVANVIEIAGSYQRSLALRRDHSVILLDQYGYWYPANFSNAVALAQGGQVVLLGDGAPFLAPCATNRPGLAGTTIHLDRPATGKAPLDYQWFQNGVPVSGATNALLSLRNLNPRQLGLYSVQASNSLGTATVSNLNVRLEGLWLGVEDSTPAQLQLGIFGPTGSRCALLSSSNLVGWTELKRLTNNGLILTVSDPKSGPGQRFYRLLSY